MNTLKDAIDNYFALKSRGISTSTDYADFMATYNTLFSELKVFIEDVDALKEEVDNISIGGRITGEVPVGSINGSNATFISEFQFIPETVEVFINGLRQVSPAHYNTSGTQTIIFTDSPVTNDVITINYVIN